MTATDTVEVQWDGEGQPPIYDSDHLRRRLAAVPADRQGNLAEAWQSHGLGALEPLMTADAYAKAERLVALHEPGLQDEDAWPRLNAVAERLYALPEHIYRNACEALRVYAGMDNPRNVVLTSQPRLEEAERIIAEAVAYAAELEANPPPSVDDLPPADDTAEQVASNDYPGSKAGVPVVKAWVESPDDEAASLNRAARAYVHEQDRSTPRKGLTQWLEAKLGADGLAKVKEALEAAAPPPLDLGATASPAGAGEGTAGPGSTSPETPSGGADDTVDGAEPAVPVLVVRGGGDGEVVSKRHEALHRIATLHHQLSEAYIELAEVS